jgi:hypothetical protein
LIAHFPPESIAQFAPESGAHFGPVLYAHFIPESGAQFDRFFQISNILSKFNISGISF